MWGTAEGGSSTDFVIDFSGKFLGSELNDIAPPVRALFFGSMSIVGVETK